MATKSRVLLVDDEPAILKVFGIKLKASGYDVITAINGDEALSLTKSTKPDIMLLDIIMPGKDGFEVLEELRTFSKLPVIVISARPESSQKAFSLGANAFLAKPFNVDDLLKAIKRLLDHAKVR